MFKTDTINFHIFIWTNLKFDHRDRKSVTNIFTQAKVVTPYLADEFRISWVCYIVLSNITV